MFHQTFFIPVIFAPDFSITHQIFSGNRAPFSAACQSPRPINSVMIIFRSETREKDTQKERKMGIFEDKSVILPFLDRFRENAYLVRRCQVQPI